MFQKKGITLSIMGSNKTVPSLLRAEHLLNEDEEIYVLKVPKTLSSKSIMDLEMNLKSPNRIFVEHKDFSPIVTKESDPKAILGQMKKDTYSPSVVEVKGIVKLRESVQVPPVPKVEIPAPYKVPHPQNLVTRHPIYGRHGAEQLTKKRKLEDIVDIKLEGDNMESNDVVEETPLKKKKKKKKNSDNEAVEVKEEVQLDIAVESKKSKKKKKHKSHDG